MPHLPDRAIFNLATPIADFCIPADITEACAMVESRFHAMPSPTPAAFPKRKYDIYLPSHSFEDSAMYLDRLELKMAQVGVLRTLKYLSRSRPSSRSARVPEAEAWRGYEQALIRYGLEVAKAYVRYRGSDTTLNILKQRVVRGEWLKPTWVYEDQTRTVHQTYLVNIGKRRSIAKAIHHILANEDFRSVAEFLRRSNFPPTLKTLDSYLLEDLKHYLCSEYDVNFRRYPNHYQQFGWDVSSCYDMRLTECLH